MVGSEEASTSICLQVSFVHDGGLISTASGCMIFLLPRYFPAAPAPRVYRALRIDGVLCIHLSVAVDIPDGKPSIRFLLRRNRSFW